MRHIVLLMLLRQYLPHPVHEGRTTVLPLIKRPNRVSVMRVTLALQPVIDIAGPLAVLALALCLMPIVPVLPAQILPLDILVAVALLAIPVRISIVHPVLLIIVSIVIVAIATAIIIVFIFVIVDVVVVLGLAVDVVIVIVVDFVAAGVRVVARGEVGLDVVAVVGAVILAIREVVSRLHRVIVQDVVVGVVKSLELTPNRRGL